MAKDEKLWWRSASSWTVVNTLACICKYAGVNTSLCKLEDHDSQKSYAVVNKVSGRTGIFRSTECFQRFITSITYLQFCLYQVQFFIGMTIYLWIVIVFFIPKIVHEVKFLGMTNNLSNMPVQLLVASVNHITTTLCFKLFFWHNFKIVWTLRDKRRLPYHNTFRQVVTFSSVKFNLRSLTKANNIMHLKFKHAINL